MTLSFGPHNTLLRDWTRVMKREGEWLIEVVEAVRTTATAILQRYVQLTPGLIKLSRVHKTLPSVPTINAVLASRQPNFTRTSFAESRKRRPRTTTINATDTNRKNRNLLISSRSLSQPTTSRPLQELQ
ncbi:hypothetical protein PGTUg99_032624 [Puccinia graminis f. sp. tritici]|uniref:Uncharacterized protein n=1 Tax=Puccinia graminis f. sp. tritici TaxID=56615 RepID=A0A5B0Q972_PUCGR|nr:hypothetical protein PGTUg99_032624 [Puccinia graminis f. sp. tritici]